MVDWWGVGVLIHEMVVGQAPWNDLSNARIMSMIVHSEFVPRDWLPKKLQDLLRRLLDKDPESRLGAAGLGGLESIQRHPFFADVDWQAVYDKTWMKPPLKIKVKNIWDTKNIDGIFLNEDLK